MSILGSLVILIVITITGTYFPLSCEYTFSFSFSYATAVGTFLPAESAHTSLSCSPSPSAITAISPPAEILPHLFLLVLYCQQPQILPVANLDFDKLVVVFAIKHPREWLFLAYSHCFFTLKVLNHASRTLPRLPYTNLKKSRTEKKLVTEHA